MIEENKIFFAPDDYGDTIECPNCGSDKTNYLEEQLRDCKCIFRKTDRWWIYECEHCKIIYGIKPD